VPARTAVNKGSSRTAVAARRAPASDVAEQHTVQDEHRDALTPPAFSWSFGEVQPSVAPPVVHETLRSPGHRLDRETRALFEARFRQPLDDVTVHVGQRAAESAQAVNALAYTVGNHVVFSAGQYSPRTPAGRGLLAHELTHVVQQRSARPAVDRLAIGGHADRGEREAEHAAADPTPLPVELLQRASIWQKFIRLIGFEGSFKDDELQAYLKFLDTQKKIEDDYDSDNKAREVVRRWKAGRHAYDLSVDRRVLLIREMLSGRTLGGDEEAILSILSGSMDVELREILKQIPAAVMRKKIGGDNRVQFDFIIAQYTRRNTDPLAGTQAATAEQHLLTETVLNPGATLEDAPVPAAHGVPPPPPKFKEPDAMTGLSPDPAHGVPGPFELEMTIAIKDFLKIKGADFRARKKAGHLFPEDKARQIGVVAQKSTEEYFGPYIQVASRAPADKYHPRKYDVGSEIHSQAEVPIAPASKDGHPGRLEWMSYWMSHAGEPVLKKFTCVTTRSPDKEEFARALGRLATDAALQADIDDTIHGWPAEASGGINLALLRDITTQDKERKVRWDIYTTLLHEMMHIVQHPNYVRTYSLFSGSTQEILKEGMADVMRHDLWDGPGQLKTRLATSNYDATRATIEGGTYDYKEEVVDYHPDYDEMKDARTIVDGDGKRKGVGMPNAKAAFFLGHTDLLGIGEGTRGAAAALAGIANYKADDARDAEIVIAQPGDTLDAVRTRTGASATGIVDEKTGKPFAPGAAVPDGTRLRIPGIRYVYTIAEDTLSTIASQNMVEPALVAIANSLPAGTPAGHTFPAGTRVLIPIHQQSRT
jgi:hypothetical protein